MANVPDNNKKLLDLSGESTASSLAAALFFLLLLYYGLDYYFLLNEYFAETAPYWLFAGVGLLAGLFAYVVLKRSDRGRTNAHLYALVIAAAAALAAYPGTIRFLALTSSSESAAYQYHLSDDLVWQGHDENVPDLYMDVESSRYWEQFVPGDHYEFQLREGGLGVWLINMEPIYADQRSFYDCEDEWDCALIF